ncbi:MAG: hypothetical protein M1818_001408 [Claussenomyces sp. TS43310]|nr:MAG: hypothetical protein M1818_001408 [Claussenomyces sp. TS43310]
MSSVQVEHPLPAPPGASPQSQYAPGHRPRSKSAFSFHSDKSHKSSGSQGKIDLHESHMEKESKRLRSKADPLLAMSEAEPSAIATMQAQQLSPIRAIQHRDANGNPIAEPDRSNPTRSRWERPLDTIRAFEAAIDGNYSRKSMVRNDSSSSVGGMNRRSSYFGGSSVGAMSPRTPHDHHYGGRPNSNAYRSDSYFENGPGNGYNPNRARYPRNASESVLHNGMGVHPGNQPSYETGTNGSGSSGEPIGYMTDPSSENSSLDRTQGGPPIPEHVDNYGLSGFESGPPPQLRSYGQNGHQDHQGMNGASFGQGGHPGLPRSQTQTQSRAPIKLGSSSGDTGPTVYEPPKPEKRKSWFGRRFSKT